MGLSLLEQKPLFQLLHELEPGHNVGWEHLVTLRDEPLLSVDRGQTSVWLLVFSAGLAAVSGSVCGLRGARDAVVAVRSVSAILCSLGGFPTAIR